MAASAIKDKQSPKKKAPPHAFKKGQSGNPSGRPTERVTLDDGRVVSLRELARGYTLEAFMTLVRSMSSSDERVATAAAEAVLSRGWGKAAQAITGEDGEGSVKLDQSIQVTFVSQK